MELVHAFARSAERVTAGKTPVSRSAAPSGSNPTWAPDKNRDGVMAERRDAAPSSLTERRTRLSQE